MNILFVCSGNIFRNMSAEYCLKDYLKRNKIQGINVSSAGITAIPQKVSEVVLKSLLNLGIDAKNHKQRKLNKKILKENNLIIAMGTNHQKFIKENFGVDSYLFLDICYGVKKGLRDVDEVLFDYYNKFDLMVKYQKWVVKFVNESMPLLLKNIKNFC